MRPMSDVDLPSILLLIVLLLFSAFFSASETALIGSRRVRLMAEAEKGHKWAKRSLKLLEDPAMLLGSILIGNNLVNIAAVALGTSLMGPAVATIVMTVVILMAGEIPPKTLSALWPESVTRVIVLPITVVTYVLRPVVWLTSFLTDLILLPFTHKLGPTRRFLSREEITTALDMSQDAGELEPGEARMVQYVLELPKVHLADIMIPAAEAAIIMRDWPLERVREEVRQRRFTRYPVFLPEAKRPNGMLHIKDLLIAGDTARWQSLVRPLPYRPHDMDADDLLREMQIARFHMTAVVDAEQNVVGYVTMEHILEEIVGVIADEHDVEADPVQTLDDDLFQVRGDLEVADVAMLLNVDIPVEDQEQTIDALYRASVGRQPASNLRLGRLLIRPAKKSFKGYIVAIMPEATNGDDHDQGEGQGGAGGDESHSGLGRDERDDEKEDVLRAADRASGGPLRMLGAALRLLR
ncbi:MAG: HlyC/CorC family transporter [Myxococcales bacterium]|nr:MAG: HlyC/CorC family transporter [Myxococcales bacterium]